MKGEYVIYRHRNLINNKCYIGKTKKAKVEYRWGANGVGYKKQPKFWRAIKKYGWDNFEHTILEENITSLEVNNKERYYIALYNSIKNGYNCLEGGINTQAVTSRKAVYQYSLNGEFIAAYTSILAAATSLNIAAGSIVKACKGQLKSCGGFMWKYEKKDHIEVIARKTNAKKVLQYTLTGVLVNTFNSIDQAAIELGNKAYKSSICSCCKHNLKSAFNYVWRYEDDLFYYQQDIHHTKQIKQYDLDNNLIKIWNSEADIYKNLGIRQGNIYACCNGARKTAGGYIWKYYNDEEK